MNGFLSLAWSERLALIGATIAHLELVLEALLIAVAIGVPVGILATRSKTFERLAMTAANVLQTIPSLALLGFLLILYGGTIGKPPALTALVVYALLPIIKNTILGLVGLDRGVAEAATGMGMTRWQRLVLVELPLAVPVLLGGVRVAAVASVGMATIAAAIGAKGLGSFIYRGVSLSDPRLILLGAVPAAALALVFDATLGEVERWLDPRRKRVGRGRGVLAILGAALILVPALWGLSSDLLRRDGGRTIVIGSKDGGEMILLGHMLADLVEDRTSLRVERSFNLGGTLVCFNALEGGGLDAYVEYSGTALTTILHEAPRNDPAEVRDLIRRQLASKGIAALDSLGFENTFAILMRRNQAESLGIRRISDVPAHASEIRPGFGPEFMNRPDGYPALVRTYGLKFPHAPAEMDRNLLYEAVARRTIDLAAGDSTDGRIATLDLVQLKDDRRCFPPYEALPLVREATLRRFPELRSALDALAGKIDEATMRRLNREVDQDRRNPEDVAREYLRSVGLLR